MTERPASTQRHFGLLGGFAGDEAKLAQVARLAEQMLGPQSESVEVNRVIAVLDTLPFSGRVELILEVVCASHSRDRLVRSLFDACFVTAQPQLGSVGIGSNQVLDPQRVPLLRLVVIALPRCGRLGVDLFHAYSKSSSTILFKPFLEVMVASPVFSDDELEAVFVGTVDDSRRAILSICKRYPHRSHFLARLIEKGLAPLTMLPYANAEAVDAFLASGREAAVAELEQSGLSNWPRLGPVYQAHLRRRLRATAGDPIRRGSVFRAFERRMVEPQPNDIVELLKICEEDQPLEIATSVPPDVRTYLTEMSRRGELTGAYQGLSLVLPESHWIRTMRAEDKVALLTSSTTKTTRGWAFFETHHSLCSSILTGPVPRPSHKELFLELAKAALDAVSEEVVWKDRTGAKPDDVQLTFQSFAAFLDVAKWPETRLAKQGVDIWLALHRRTTPTAAVVERYAGQKTEEDLWSLWTNSALVRILGHAKAIARKGALALSRSSVHAGRSSITSYIPYLKLLVDAIQSVLDAPGQRCHVALHLNIAADLAEATEELFRRAEGFSGAMPSVGSRAVDALRSTIESMFGLALERARTSLVFDPAKENYVTSARHREIAQRLTRIAQLAHITHLPALKGQLLELCESILNAAKIPASAARLGFVEVAAKDKKTSFAHFDSKLHGAWSATALELLQSVRVACGALEANRDIARRAWHRIKLEKFGGAVPPETDPKLLSYIEECHLLPASVLAEEKEALVKAGMALLKANQLDPIAHRFAQFGWLMDVLDGGSDQLPTREKYLLKHGDIALPSVRELMQNATSDREPTVRIQAHLALLNRSQHNLSELATTLAFVAKRIKNEAGLYRPALYTWMQERTGTIVKLSLEKARQDVAAALDAIDTICDALTRMLRDDVSKRDTVAKSAFRSIATLILSEAMTFDCACQLLDARRRWIACAVQLDWIVVRALEGETGSQSFVWPIATLTMSRQRTIPEGWLDAMGKFAEAHLRGGKGRFDQLRMEVYEQKYQREGGDNQRFEVGHAVELLVETLRAVERSASTSMDDLPDELQDATSFPASTSSSSTLLRRAQALFAFARTQWTEVPRLVRFFDAMVGSLNDNRDHFEQTLALFENVQRSYPPKSLWFEIPSLSRACDRLFETAVRLQVSDAARRLRPLWIEVRQGQGRTPIANALTRSQVQFLITHLPKLDTAVLDTSSLVERRCTSSRLLLEMTPSAAYVVTDTLIALRDDLLTTYTRKSRGELYGVFDPSWSATPLKDHDAKERPALPVAPKLWPNLNGVTMRAYTRDALEDAMNVARSPQARSASIALFVQSPASSHTEIIDLLRKLIARPKERSEEPSDDARELLLETVILCVFQTDAAWFVLAFLLSPEVIAASPRTTASILSNLHAWVPMDKAVSVLRVLLQPDRRWAIQTFLHKAILRLLFDANLPEARALFTHEWTTRKDTKLHPDVQHDMVKLAVSALASPDPDKATMAWKIVEEVAIHPAEFGPTTVFLLLLPTWKPAVSFQGQRSLDALLRIAIPNSEVPDSFGLLHGKWLAEGLIPFESPLVRDHLASLLRTIAASTHPYLRTVATCAQFTLSPCAAGQDDEASLSQLEDLLLAASVHWKDPALAELPKPGTLSKTQPRSLAPEDDYFLQVAPKIFASLGLQVLTKRLQAYTEYERQTAQAHADLCTRDPVAARLRRVFHQLLESLARVAPIEVNKRDRLSRVAQGLLTTARQWGFADALLTRHFVGILHFLQNDIDLVTPLV